MPAFQSPESGVIGFSALAEYWHAQQLLLEAPPPLAAIDRPDLDAAAALAATVAGEGRTLLTEPESKRLLAAFGIPVPRTEVAATAARAVTAAKRIGYPLAMKILSPDIAHKSDVNGVTLNVRDEAELRREFGLMMKRVRAARPQARITGVALQPMVEKRFGRELMIGVARDDVFGQVISFGAGGVAVELLRDNAIGLPPLNARLAGELIDRTRISGLLGAYRHIPAADRQAIIDVLIRVSDMVCACPWIREMDINPLVADDRSAVALDARVVIDAAQLPGRAGPGARTGHVRRYGHLAIHPYPAELEGEIRLNGGQRLRVRPIRPEDAAIELAFVEALSDHSRYMRFFNPTKTLEPRLLARLTQLDYEREMALIALDDGGMRGVARYSPMSDGTTCEFAVTVADAWQGRGLATELMRRLIDCARDAGYLRIAGTVLSDNHDMHRLMARLGFTGTLATDDLTVIEFARALA